MICKVISLAATSAFVGVDALQVLKYGMTSQLASEDQARHDKTMVERAREAPLRTECIVGDYKYSFQSKFSSDLQTDEYTLKVYQRDAGRDTPEIHSVGPFEEKIEFWKKIK